MANSPDEESRPVSGSRIIQRAVPYVRGGEPSVSVGTGIGRISVGANGTLVTQQPAKKASEMAVKMTRNEKGQLVREMTMGGMVWRTVLKDPTGTFNVTPRSITTTDSDGNTITTFPDGGIRETYHSDGSCSAEAIAPNSVQITHRKTKSPTSKPKELAIPKGEDEEVPEDAVDSRACVICLANKKQCMVLDCQHKAYCIKCSQELLKGPTDARKCSVCQMPIKKGIVKVFE